MSRGDEKAVAEQSKPRLACIACSSDIREDALPHCVVHSCCGRPVCASCLASRSRLATFCVRCEGVSHALRDRGPRADVTRAGHVVFDADHLMDEDDGAGERPSMHAINDDGNDKRSPPPYVALQDAAPTNTFDIGADDSVDIGIDSTSHRQGDSKEPSVGLIPESKPPALLVQNAATPSCGISPATANPRSESALSPMARNVSQNLRKALELVQDAQDADTSPAASKQERNAFPHPSHSRSSSHGRSTIKSVTSNEEDDAKLTRQYWLRPNDSLMSLSLRFRVSALELCRLNDLPPSTATSTPHLVYTRPFLLIPERSIQTALARASGNENTSDVNAAMDELEMGLQGPAPMTRTQKLRRARREAQNRFRALVAQTEGRSRSANVDVTPCDERAARAYISLMETELRHIDFGDDGDAARDDAEVKDGSMASRDIDRVGEGVEDDVLLDAARQRRYDAIVQQAVARWAMDSEWERKQRAEGRQPETRALQSLHSSFSSAIEEKNSNRTATGGSTSNRLLSWLEPSTQSQSRTATASRWKTVMSPSSHLPSNAICAEK